ncbi:EGF-like repeat and discoidin I-like domain-containing protein 3 [Dendronephthya gigantea]|uniref:EGF-like repeat and discoidin I-like domain-containing protein 3 n=1 Tax=Dendronephthya gigantea TaxID=151771 RepID=UPI00106BF5B4|nr:EGF-like repeat and discoidin I-like domain-containing protein 3 [Dendronephthya gigantea]
MEDGSIHDSQITASSNFDNNHRDANGRLNFIPPYGISGAWCARSNDLNQWLQVNFQRLTLIAGISTQGRFDNYQFVKSYTVSFSKTGGYFMYYTQGEATKADSLEVCTLELLDSTLCYEFQGNSDQNTIVHRKVIPPISARLIRLHPTTWQNHISMRVEFYGYRAFALGMEDGSILDSQITASSNWNNNHRGANGRLNFTPHSGRTGAWSALSNDINQWLQVNFQRLTLIAGISTQGRSDYNQFVRSYTISFSKAGGYFTYYTQREATKVY